MDALLKLVQTINAYLSDYILIILLVGTGLYFTIRTRFVQVRCFGEGWRRMFSNFSLRGGRQDSGMSSFQALATAIAAQVGTGNIVGACGAILTGGPGAIFWMWIIAFFGMATIYAEAVLAQKTRSVAADGTVHGGPVYYIRKVFKGGFGKFLAGFFAVATILALGFMGAMVQSNSIGEACSNAFGVPSWIIGVVIAALAAVVFIGGVQRLASVTEKLVPVMAILYIVGGLAVLIVKIANVPEAIGMIFRYAFHPEAIIGGVLASGAADGVVKTNMAQLAFGSVFGEKLGSIFVAVCLLFFAFSTILSWNLFGRLNVNYLFGKKAGLAYSVIAVAFIFLGSCLSNDLVWELTDMFNQLMVLPNVMALIPLGGLVAAAARRRG